MISLNDQWAKIQAIQNGSWRKRTMPTKGLIIKAHLIETIQKYCNNFPTKSSSDTAEIRFRDVVNALSQDKIMFDDREFWGTLARKNKPYTYRDVFTGIGDGNSPALLYQILAQYELLRIKDQFMIKATPMIHCNDEYENDELVRILFLCGTFAKKIKENNYEPCFSGTLIPGGAYNNVNLSVHTCLHAFIDVKTIEGWYFIPYGLELKDDNAFPVDSVYLDTKMTHRVTPEQLVKFAEEFYQYKNSDYAFIKIKNTSVGQKKIKDRLIARSGGDNVFNQEIFNDFNVSIHSYLPNLNHNTSSLFKSFYQKLGMQNNILRHYTIIGRPGYEQLKFDDSGFAISVNLDDTYANDPNQSSEVNNITPIPPNIGNVKSRIGMSYPAFPGMSGGIILKTCSYSENNKTKRICQILGTVWGGDRVFSLEPRQMTDLLSFVNRVV